MTALDEAAYFAAWQDMYATRADASPQVLAVAGGACAGNLAQVFIAGYQAAIRATFAQTELPGWVAFVVSEDRSEVDPLPGLTAEIDGNSVVLNGHKTWVAAAARVQHLVVRAAGEQPGLYQVARDTPGLRLHLNASPPMLPELSQGRAEFSQVRLTADSRLDDSRVKDFAAQEARCIYLAFAAFVQHAAAQTNAQDISQAATLTLQQGIELDPAVDPATLASFDQTVQHLRQQAAALLFADDAAWQRDQRLVQMYSKGIQARAEKAR